VDAGAVGKIFLTPPFRLAQGTYISSEAQAYIHASLKPAMTAIDLQTISHIRG